LINFLLYSIGGKSLRELKHLPISDTVTDIDTLSVTEILDLKAILRGVMVNMGVKN
jgi:hypothetical protein